jgi:DNA (cytosine-5)-methyltransferase 1
MKRLRVFEAFAGVGSQRMALRNIGIKHEVVAIAEIDGFTIDSYMAIHGRTLNVGDISQVSVDQIPDHDLFTYSFPCQDISISGEKEGLAEGSGTRSSLLWECKKVIAGKLPRYLLLENVKNLVGTKNIADFHKWLNWLEDQGYKNYWKVVNAKDHDIPQNRERVFVVSVLQEGQVQLFDEFEFPIGTEPTKVLRDILEQNVPEKYFLSEAVQQRFQYKPEGVNVIGTTAPDFRSIGWRDTVFHTDSVMGSLLATDYKQPKQILVVGSTKPDAKIGQRHRVYDPAGAIATLEHGDFRQPKQIIVDARIGGGSQHIKILNDYRIRKLTPREYWRLMGFTDADFDKARFQSDTQLYKQAGNSIVVPVLEAIFSQLFKGAY